jgi:hypothetical protein
MLVALFLGYMIFRQLKKARNRNPNRLPLPPGPKGYYLLIGNLFDIPVGKPWLIYDEWCKTYGKASISNGLWAKYYSKQETLGDITDMV